MNWRLSPVGDIDEFVAGSVLEYSCAEGFKFDAGGSVRSLVCLTNGSWHATPTPCTRKYPLCHYFGKHIQTKRNGYFPANDIYKLIAPYENRSMLIKISLKLFSERSDNMPAFVEMAWFWTSTCDKSLTEPMMA